jgi:PhnB protein
MKVQPYLYFDGRTEEALEFYKKAVGAETMALMRFKENPQPQYNPPNSAEKVMHASFRIGETELMASDGDCAGQTKFQGISLALNAKDGAEAERLFAALSDSGQVQMPMTQTFFAERFGMVADKFGVSWMVVSPPAGG